MRESLHVAPVGAAAAARHYLRDMVYGASDGIVTTFAVVAGVAGGALSPTVALIIGAANLLADGLSMAVGNYLSIHSHEGVRRAAGLPEEESQPVRHAVATFAAFAAAGLLPLLPYILPVPPGARFVSAIVLTLGAVRDGCVPRDGHWRGLACERPADDGAGGGRRGRRVLGGAADRVVWRCRMRSLEASTRDGASGVAAGARHGRGRRPRGRLTAAP